MKSYKDIRKELAEPPTADGWKEQLPCALCGRLESRESLCNQGGRCASCYSDYCRSAFSAEALKRRMTG